MDALKDYFFCAMTASIMIGLAENLVNERMKVFVRFISGLFIIIILALPVLNIVAGFTGDLYDIASGELTVEYTDRSAEEGIKGQFSALLKESVRDYIYEISGIVVDVRDIKTELDVSENNEISIILITVTSDALKNKTEIERALTERYGTETVIVNGTASDNGLSSGDVNNETE